MIARFVLLLNLFGIAACMTSPVESSPGTATVVTRGDAVIRLDARGRDANGSPITGETRMRVASLSKSFTAAAVLTLVDEGTVDLDRPVTVYLPDFRMADDRAGSITVRQPAPLTITLGACALAGLATLLARLRWLGSAR